ncbi:MAG TPA: glycosyl hydrolase family 18 protein, partial [Anaerolineae bacterium]|nr:glycosyl hydrolase family 18 protein [Anaerolineae bacterium]
MMQDSYNKSYRRSRRRNTPETKPNPFIYFLESIVEGRLSGCMINALVVGLVLLVLVLPPISLVDRVMGIGYERIGVDGGSIRKEGLELNFPSEGMNRAFRVQADVIPRSEFLEGSAGNSLIQAAENIPPNLTLRSPYYRLRWRDTPPEAIFARVPLPRDIEDINTADLYTWNGEAWEWLPNLKAPTERVIEAGLDYLPQSFVVMSTYPVNPSIATDYQTGTVLPDGVSDTIVELNPVGLYLGANGAIDGTLAELPPDVESSTMLVIPSLRNWYDDGSVRADLIDNLLVDADLRQLHIENIVDLVQRNAYQGIDLDYRHVSPDLREEFAVFIQELDAALPDNKILSVRVGLPRQVSPQDWETDGYDYRAIGQAADVIKIPAFPDPRVYVPGGQMDAMLNWATGQINRYKIQLVLSTLSTEEVNGVLRTISYDQALQPIGEVIVVGERQTANPGEQVDFTLNGLEASTGIQFDAQTGAYWFAYLDQQDVQRTVYLENATSIARKLQFVAQYNLRGVAMENLLNQRNDAQLWTVMNQFLNLVIPPVESKYSVVWRVQAEDGGVVAEEVVDLSSPEYSWTAPQGGGTFQVNA